MFSNLGHLFDKREDSSSIPTYLKVSATTLEPATIDTFRDRYAQLAIRAKPMLTARHKAVAHIDVKLSEKEVFADLQFTWNELRDLIDDTCNLVTDLIRQHDVPVAVFESQRYMEATLKLIKAIPTKAG